MPASGMRAPAESPRRVRVKASCRDASSFENRLRPRSPVGSPPEPADTLRQLARGTHMVRGEEASTFFRLTRSCFIYDGACARVRKEGKTGGSVQVGEGTMARKYGAWGIKQRRSGRLLSCLCWGALPTNSHRQVLYIDFDSRGRQDAPPPLGGCTLLYAQKNGCRAENNEHWISLSRLKAT